MGTVVAMKDATLHAHQQGSGQGKEVVSVDHPRISVGPDMRQVEDLKCEFSRVNRDGRGDG